MFDEELKTIKRAYPGIVPLIAIYTKTQSMAYSFAIKLNQPHIIIQYDSPHEVHGCTLAGAVLLDPPGNRATMPESLEHALSSIAKLAEVEWTSLVKVYRNDQPAEESIYDGSRWFCQSCTCVRPASPCWKCGPDAEGHPVVAGYPDLNNPDITVLREVARTLGYCIAEHGSKERDIDLVAIPWTEDAVGHEQLVKTLAEATKTPNGETHIYGPERKPNGRVAYNLQLNGWYKLIDLSVTPHGRDLL